MKYKALITDVDGTLVPMRRDGMPSPRVRETIKKAKDIIHIGVATSRPLFMMQEIFSVLELSGPSVIGGGSQIYDTTTKKIIFENVMNVKLVDELAQKLKKYTDNFVIGDSFRDNDHNPNAIPDRPLSLFAFALEEKDVEKIIKECTSSEVSVLKLNSYEKGKFDVELADIKSTKQHGIFKVAEILGIETHEIIGIGDSYNDFPLLMACGLKVAMGNAVRDLKAIADYVAPSVESDGLADVLEKFVLNQ